MARLVGVLLGLVEQTVTGGVGSITTKRAANLDGCGARLGALGALELSMTFIAADVAVVFLPGRRI